MNKDNLKITTYKDGGKDYVFISYCSKDAGSGENKEDIVFDKYVVPLQEKYGMRLFCDKDFKNHATENWSDQMEENIKDASLCLIFTSKDYVCSYACFLEVYTAILNNIPILKIQINSPEPAPKSNNTTKTISTATRNQFVGLREKLNCLESGHPKFKYREFFNNIKKYLIDDGEILVRRLSVEFSNCLGAIASTTININDGLDAIVNSINNATKGANVFEMPETSAADTESKPEAIVPVTESKPQETHKAAESVPQSVPDNTVKAKSSGFAAKGDENYSFYGIKQTGNQAQMLTDIIHAVIEKHPDKLGVISQGITCVKTEPIKALRSKNIPYFKSGSEFTSNGTVYSIGTAYSRMDKIKMIRKAINLADEDPREFEAADLYSEAQLSEAVKHYEECKAKSNNSSASIKKAADKTAMPQSDGKESYSFYGIKRTGNQAQMMTDIIQAIIERHFDMLDVFSQKLTCVKAEPITELRRKGVTYFSSGSEFEHKGVIYSIGTSYGRQAKISLIQKAIKLANEDPQKFEFAGSAIADVSPEPDVSSNTKAESDSDTKFKLEILCCFLSKYNDEAASLLGYKSQNAAFKGISEQYEVKVKTLTNIRDTFDPFFPESGRKGWYQRMDKISDRRKAIIDTFKAFNSVDEAFAYVQKNL